MSPIRRLTRPCSGSSAPAGPTRACRSTGAGDAIDELTSLFNTMLDKIEGLVTAMRGALDNVSHDLRTPLTRLRGTAEMALRRASPTSIATATRSPTASRSPTACWSMLNTLMDISEAESGTMQLRREPVPLAEVVARAVDLYRDVADAKGVTLAVDRAGDVVGHRPIARASNRSPRT